jgi:hypothetical protein
MERRGLVGKEDALPAAPDAAATGEKLAALAAALRAGKDEGKKDLLRKGLDKVSAALEGGGVRHAELPEESHGALRTALDGAAAKVEAIPSDLPFEEIEHKLSSIESSLVRVCLKAMNSTSLAFVEDRVASALGDVSGLAPQVVDRMRKALTRREVRALAGLPPLTLLHG